MEMNDLASSPDVFDPTCSARHALEVISEKWAVLILSALAECDLRNGEMLRRLGNISQKMLSQTLRNLERNGIVTRIDHKTVPPCVVYQLTDVGRSLIDILTQLDQWAVNHFPKLDRAREAYDKLHCFTPTDKKNPPNA
jgi:DNA-binding HxlR family transcriptional regulator